MLGPGPRLIKKEFTGPQSHKGWETLIYTIENRPGIRNRVTSFYSLEMPFSLTRLRRLEEMHEYRFFCLSSKQITPCINAFSEVRRMMIVGVFNGCKWWVTVYKKNSDNILSPHYITAAGLFHVIFYPFSHKTHLKRQTTSPQPPIT